jgi:hypothetical protein
MTTKTPNPHIGSDFEDFLEEVGLAEWVNQEALAFIRGNAKGRPLSVGRIGEGPCFEIPSHLLDDINIDEGYPEEEEQQRYMVFWQMPIMASSPRDAAEKAQYMIAWPDMISGVFDVVDDDGIEHRVDVSISEEEEIEQDLELLSIGC